ncbi:hypothetical protein B5M09_011001 [Aphanomyces astaci]|uniref:Uncharacterized protein n=1 Tax=Aphanomyces astaci TaxID=112090 RepID=A0A425CYM7_APHAT|nr:hypothetical protein B5M09_011001 [Aphanomyces astaci]
MHKEVLNRNEQHTCKAAKATDTFDVCNVAEGDNVLWSRVDERYYPQLLVTWIDPYCVKSVGEISVVLDHLVTHEEREAHSSHVMMYEEASFEVTEEILEHVSSKELC